MACTYIYNGTKYESYADLLAKLENESMDGVTDLIFSQASKQDLIYDKVRELKVKAAMDIDHTELIDGSPDLKPEGGDFTTQTFIDSKFFKIGEQTPIFQLSTEDYVDTMKKRFVDRKEMTQEGADAWGARIQERWNAIAKDALDFHQLIMADSSVGLFEWGQRTADTAFSGITSKVQEAENQISRQVWLRNGLDRRGTGDKGKLIKNLNFQADLRNMTEKIFGHVDYLMVRDNGDIEVFNVKTSTEPYSQWSEVKKEKYRYQLALLKQMLAFHGIDSSKVRVNIIPVQIKYDDNLSAVTDIFVQSAVPMDVTNMQYSFAKYDGVASQFISATVDFSNESLESLIKVSTQLQHIFPDKDIKSEGITQTAKEWVAANWKYCNPQPQPNGGFKLKLPDTNEEIIVSDPRSRDNNEEFVNIVQDRISENQLTFSGPRSAYYLRTDIENAFRSGVFTVTDKSAKGAYIQAQFEKYFRDRTINKDGTFNYKWKLVKSTALDAANIIAFVHESGQMDVFTISSMNPGSKYSFKGRDNLLGYYLPDMNDEGFEMECNYGNMEAIRTVALLNELLPEIGGSLKLGQLKVIGLSNFHSKKGAYFEFSSLLKQWDTIVKIINQNTDANIVNNLRANQVKTVLPEEVLLQTFNEIVSDTDMTNLAEITSLNDVLLAKKQIDGMEVPGLISMQTIEGKIEKVELFLDRLRDIAREQKMDLNNPEEIIKAQGSSNKLIASVAKLFTVASHVLSTYYGDIPLNNEKFGSLAEYVAKPTSAPNSSVRHTAVLTQRTIDNIRSEMLEKFTPTIRPIFDRFYEACGYTKIRNATIGDQARMFNHLYQLDEEGKNTYLFKNPYDDASDLQAHERQFLKEILYEFYKIRCNMRHITCDISGINDPKLKTKMPENYLYVPLQKASSASNLLNFGKSFNRLTEKLHRMFTKPKEAFEEGLGYLTSEDSNLRDNEVANLRVYNPFTRSELNMRERDMMLSERKEGYYETNVENIMVDFLYKQIQCDEFNKLLVRIKGIQLALLLRGFEEGDDKDIKHAIKAIDDYVTINVYNKTIMEATSQRFEVFMRPLRKLVSSVYIAANPIAAVRDVLQGLQENFVKALIKFQTDIGAKDVAFGYKEVFREGPTNMMTMTRLNQFNIKWGISNFDAAKVSERLKTGRSGVLNPSNWAYSTLRGPDYLNRMTLLIAKMHHDGVYDAYTLDENHRLVYNWRLDKRFNIYASGDTSNPEYNKQRSLYMSMVRAFNTEGSGKKLSYTDDLPDAYTAAQVRAIKNLGESIYGSYDESLKSKYEHIAIGRNFMFFSTWLNGIIDTYYKKRQVSQSELKLVQETNYNGELLYFTPDKSGNTTTIDTGIPVMKYVPIMVQGIYQTFEDTFKSIAHEGWDLRKSDIWKNEVNIRNYKRLLSDMAVAAFWSLLFGLWLTPAYKEHKANDDGNAVATNLALEYLYKGSLASFDTFKGPFAILTYVGESTNPATYTLQKRFLTDAWKLAIGEKSLSQVAIGSQAFFRSMQDSYRMYMRDTKTQ